MTIVYQNLHIFAYYRGGTELNMVKAGFDNARKVIEMISKLMDKTPELRNIVCEPEAKYADKKKTNKSKTPSLIKNDKVKIMT